MATEFTVERVDEVFEKFFKAQDELLEAIKFLSKINLQPIQTWITVTQAAERSGLPKRTIQNWAAKNKIQSRRIAGGNVYEVLLEDVNNFASHRVAV